MANAPTSLDPDAELHAYVDGELDADRRMAVEAYLAANPAAAARVHDYLFQKEALRRGLDLMAGGDVPATERLAGRLHQRLGIDRLARRLAPLAAGVLLVVGGWNLGMWLNAVPDAPPQAIPAFAGEAVEAHSTAVALTALQSAIAPTDLAAMAEAMARRIGGMNGGMSGGGVTMDLPAADPNLTLVRATVVPWGDGPALQFVYREPDGELLTLFVAADRSVQDGGLHTVDRDSLRLVYWRAGMVAYTVTGNKADGDLMAVAKRMADSTRRS